MPTEDLNRLRLEVVDAALESEDYDQAFRECMTLISAGVDVRDRLARLAEQGLVDRSVLKVAASILGAPEDLNTAVIGLRELATTSTSVGHHYVALLQAAGRHVDAANAAKELHQITGAQPYLLDAALALVDAVTARTEHQSSIGGTGLVADGRASAPGIEGEQLRVAATDACVDALSVEWLRPLERGKLLTFLGGQAADEGNWVTAEDYTRRAMDLYTRPRSSDVWNNVTCLLQTGQLRRAARVIAKHKPQIRDVEDARLWINAHATVKWTHAIALEAWSLTERFPDPDLAQAVAEQIVIGTSGVQGGGDETPVESQNDAEGGEEGGADLSRRRQRAQEAVPGELHRQAFARIQRLIDEHGDTTGLQSISEPDPDALRDRLVELLQQHAENDSALEDLTRQSRDGMMPLGMLSTLLGKSYATVVIQRGLGSLPAASPDDAEHQLEVDAARQALRRPVVIDAASAVTVAGLPKFHQLTGRLGPLMVSPSSMHDLNRASFDIRGLAGSPGSARWDPETQTIRSTQLSELEFNRMHERSESLQEFAERLTVVPAPTEPTMLIDLDDRDDHRVWVDVLEVAVARGAAIYSDDLSLRRLARSEGLHAFGTPALVDAVRDEALDQAGDGDAVDAALGTHAEFNLHLVRDYIVDLVVTPEELRDLAREADWGPGVAAATLTRAKWWMENHSAIATVDEIYREALTHAPHTASVWPVATMRGIASSLKPTPAVAALAWLALRAWSPDPTIEDSAKNLVNARIIATELDLPDPVTAAPAMWRNLRDKGLITAPDATLNAVVARADELGLSASKRS